MKKSKGERRDRGKRIKNRCDEASSRQDMSRQDMSRQELSNLSMLEKTDRMNDVRYSTPDLVMPSELANAKLANNPMAKSKYDPKGVKQSQVFEIPHMSILKSKNSLSDASEISNIKNEPIEQEDAYSPMAKVGTRKEVLNLKLDMHEINELISNKPSLNENPVTSPSDT